MKKLLALALVTLLITGCGAMAGWGSLTPAQKTEIAMIEIKALLTDVETLMTEFGDAEEPNETLRQINVAFDLIGNRITSFMKTLEVVGMMTAEQEEQNTELTLRLEAVGSFISENPEEPSEEELAPIAEEE